MSDQETILRALFRLVEAPGIYKLQGLTREEWLERARSVLDMPQAPLRKPTHPDQFGYTEAGYREWMRDNNSA